MKRAGDLRRGDDDGAVSADERGFSLIGGAHIRRLGVAAAIALAVTGCRAGFEQDPIFTQDVGDATGVDGGSGDVSRPDTDDGSLPDVRPDGQPETDAGPTPGYCGNGIIDPPGGSVPGSPRSPRDAAAPAIFEQCDDGQNPPVPGDGCDALCQREDGWLCPEPGKPCTPDCGDGLTVGTEACDVGNQLGVDGCEADCSATMPGWECLFDPTLERSVCFAKECGDGFIAGDETCDPGEGTSDPNCVDCQQLGCVSSPEVCDGEDNDCDGEIDEGTTTACPVDACGGGGGFSYCVDGDMGPCLGAVQLVEVCGDAIDNDCDGEIDETDSSLFSCAPLFCSDDASTLNYCQQGGDAPVSCIEPSVEYEEICGDGEDNDCDGVIDEGCAPDCLWVRKDSPGGDGTIEAPFKTIQGAILTASENLSLGFPTTQVCVMCDKSGASLTIYDEAITMAPGVNVTGGFPSGDGACITELKATNAVVATFPAGIGTTPTTLQSFKFARQAGVEANIPSPTILIEASGARLIDAWVRAPGGAGFSVGVAVTASAVTSNGDASDGALIARTRIESVGPSERAAGVHAVDAPVRVLEMCGDNLSPSQACTQRCTTNGPGIYLTGGGTAEEHFATGIFLNGAAGSVIDQVSSCVLGGVNAVGLAGQDSMSDVRITRSSLHGGNATTVGAGAIFNKCKDTQPELAYNHLLSGAAASFSVGLSASDGCPVHIHHTQAIIGADDPEQDSETTIDAAVGIRCARSALEGIEFSSEGARSACVIHDNLIKGSTAPNVDTAAGLACAGSCSLVTRNTIEAADDKVDVLAIGTYVVGQSDGLFDRNRIYGGCGAQGTAAVRADGARARFTNNLIVAGGNAFNCILSTINSDFFVGFLLTSTDNHNELDIHSNFISGRALGQLACTSFGVLFDESSDLGGFFKAPKIPLGILRNNVVGGGECTTEAAIASSAQVAIPRILEHNLLLSSAPVTLQGVGVIDSVEAINGVSPLFSGNLIGSFTTFGDLYEGVLGQEFGLINGGTSAAAPSHDINGDSRPFDGAYDIGPYEYGPNGFKFTGATPTDPLPPGD